ncbi:uncharacterized protein [Clytia hemisphaerica]|uniref:Uncharacterized protein n=1 Tax=Clytia hemisphaerica TaxID=252671 RepID=A0A7M5VD58_9CNID|eukprot:TCONS_00067105-protein
MKKRYFYLIIVLTCAIYVSLFLRRLKPSTAITTSMSKEDVSSNELRSTETIENDHRTVEMFQRKLKGASSTTESHGEATSESLPSNEKDVTLLTRKKMELIDNIFQKKLDSEGSTTESQRETREYLSVVGKGVTNNEKENVKRTTTDMSIRQWTTDDKETSTTDHFTSSKPNEKNSSLKDDHSTDDFQSTESSSQFSTDESSESPDVTEDLPSGSPDTDDRDIQYCNPDSIYRKNSFKFSRKDVSCVPVKASEKSCKWAEELYHPDKKLQKCDPAQVVEICWAEGGGYRCSMESCMSHGKHYVMVWKVNDKNGKLEKFRWFNVVKDLEKSLSVISRMTQREGFGFLLLQCVNMKEKESESKDLELGQLLILQPTYRSGKASKETVNINLLWVDSVSRSHFYRSLPKTINTFENINRDKSTKTEILDFELFQAVAGHTNHILHGLFTGNLFPKDATKNEKQVVEFGAFFKRFSDEGYRTLYHDDLCYEQVWGLRLNLGTPTTWKDFKRLLNANYIDSTGLTFSSCHLLRHNGIDTPFNGPQDRSLCFNGRFMDAYHLTFNHHQHKYSVEQQNKLITFNVICVGHDDKGTRIQSIDQDLLHYVQKMSEVKNTLTLVFADHGNTYTSYAMGVQGRFEQFHPSFFMIVPEGVQKSLGANIMNNLRENQVKLVSIMDLHKALVALPRQPQSIGLFGEIPNERTCNDLPLVFPNFCVCQNWSTPLKNDQTTVHFLHFAVGKLNEEITKSQNDISQNGLPARCKLLVPTSFDFITERINGKTKVTSFDFEVPSGNFVTEKYERFHVEIESLTLVGGSNSLKMKLVTFDRISPYGPYRACANKNANIKLCICDDENTMIRSSRRNRIKLSKLDLPNRTTMKSVRNQPCLLVHKIVYPDSKKNGFHSIAYHIINKCSNSFQVTLLFGNKLVNLRTSTPLPFRGALRPYRAVFMGNIVRLKKVERVVEPKVKVKVLKL